MTKTGTLTNVATGQEAHGMLENERLVWIDFRFDGTTYTNSLKASEWTFAEDIPPIVLPTTIGSVAKRNGSMPFVRIGADTWIMPMSGSPYGGIAEKTQASDILARPTKARKYAHTDAEVIEYLSHAKDRDFVLWEAGE